jgi:hypothetical protein
VSPRQWLRAVRQGWHDGWADVERVRRERDALQEMLHPTRCHASHHVDPGGCVVEGCPAYSGGAR